MTTKRKTRKSTEDRRAQVAALHDELDAFKATADPAELAVIFARFDGYSERNAMLIAMQRPDATDVSGFHAWHDRGRRVMKGQHGIAILAPAGTSTATEPGPEGNGETTTTRQWFRVAYVFDIASTEPADALVQSS
jgi:hypothetical protein